METQAKSGSESGSPEVTSPEEVNKVQEVLTWHPVLVVPGSAVLPEILAA